MRNKVEIIKKLLGFVVLLSIAIFLAACGIYYFEREAQPEAFGSFLDTMRYTLLTLTTIGYEDTYPTTVGGKVFTAIVGVTGYLIGIACFVAIVFGLRTLIKKFASLWLKRGSDSQKIL